MRHEELRKVRLNKLLNSIREAKIANKKKLIGMMGMEWGVARRTGLEYLQTLEMAGKIEIDGLNITIKE